MVETGDIDEALEAADRRRSAAKTKSARVGGGGGGGTGGGGGSFAASGTRKKRRSASPPTVKFKLKAEAVDAMKMVCMATKDACSQLELTLWAFCFFWFVFVTGGFCETLSWIQGDVYVVNGLHRARARVCLCVSLFFYNLFLLSSTRFIRCCLGHMLGREASLVIEVSL